MLAEAAQAAQEVAKNGSSFTVAIPTSFATIAVWKLAEMGIRAVRGKPKNGDCPKPGEAGLCKEHDGDIRKHQDEIVELKTKQGNTDKVLDEVKLDVKELLRRVPPK